MRPTGLLIALLAGAAALVLAVLLDASIDGASEDRPGYDSAQSGTANGVAPTGPARRSARSAETSPTLAPVDVAPITSAPLRVASIDGAPRLGVQNAEYRLEPGRGEWIAARVHPGQLGTSDDLSADPAAPAPPEPRFTAFVPPGAAEVRAAGHSAQAVQWIEDPEVLTGRRGVIRPDSLLLVRAPGLGASGATLDIDDAWHERSGRRMLTPAVLLVEALDDDTIAVAVDTERWRPVLDARTAEGRMRLTPYTSTSVFWRADPGARDVIDLDVPASWIAFERLPVELHEHGAGSEQAMARTVRARLHAARSVRRSLSDRVRVVTNLGSDVIEERHVHPHPTIDLPVGLGPVTASIVREDGRYGVLSFEPGARRVEVEMIAPSPITGRVVDARGEPVPGAAVMLHLPLPRDRDWLDGCVTRAGDDGTFELMAPGPPPLRIVEPGEPIALPTLAYVLVKTDVGAAARVPITLLPGRTIVCGDIVVEFVGSGPADVTFEVPARVRPTLGEVLEIAWSASDGQGRSYAHTAEISDRRWTTEDELECELAPGAWWPEVPDAAIVRTTTGTFGGLRDGDLLVLGPTYPLEVELEIASDPLDQLVLSYSWHGTRCVAAEFGPSLPDELTWTGSLPGPGASLTWTLRDLLTGRVRAAGSTGRVEEFEGRLRVGR